MKNFTDKIAVIAGGGTGIGRELARQLAAVGCHVAIGDIINENLEAALQVCRAEAPAGTRVTGHLVDVAIEADMQRFSDEVRQQHATDQINLLFNNAGIGGGGSFVKGDRQAWEKTFGVSWYGVYYGCRAFLDMVLAADEAHIVNTSSVNGLHASLGPSVAHTAYCAAKFAIRGFSEALINDLRLHAPHVHVSVVFPGSVETSMVTNTSKVLGLAWGLDTSDEELVVARGNLQREGQDVGELSDQQVRAILVERRLKAIQYSLTSAADAAKIILEGVRDNRWRILIGDDARVLDQAVRAMPEEAYDADFLARVRAMAETATD